MSIAVEPPEAEALIQGYLEGSLTDAESLRLSAALEQEPVIIQSILDGLREERLLRTVLAEMPATRPVPRQPRRFRVPRLFEFSWLPKPALFAFAGCAVALAIIGGFWWLAPTMGQPVLVDVTASGVFVERAAQLLPGQAGTSLRPGDVLLTTTNGTAIIAFGTEKTHLTLRPGTELQLASSSGAKMFNLRLGKLEGSVARQRPFRPMVLKTPLAEARVLGTRFTLTVATNSTRLDVAEGSVRFIRLTDLQHVQVATGHYAVAAVNHELAPLPATGGILREFWSGAAATNLYEIEKDPRFPKRPNSRDLAPALELLPVQTNSLVVRFRGYLHPPVTGDYEFWLDGASKAELFMSPSERAEDAAHIAQVVERKTWDAPRLRGPSNWSGPLPLVAGRRYYIEALLLVEQGDGHLSVAWKGPGRGRELLTGEFLSPANPKK